MATKLERFLESIDPSGTIDETAARADAALNVFTVNPNGVPDGESFEHCLGRFLCHLDNHCLRLNPPWTYDPKRDIGRCYNLLVAEYGKDGVLVANDLIVTGQDGGLYGVLRAVARRRANQYAQTEIAARVSVFWRGLNTQEQLDVAEEYIKRFRDLLPAELTEGTGVRMKIRFWKVLEQHPYMVHRLRGVGR